MSYLEPSEPRGWYSTPPGTGGPMLRFEPAPARVPAHWYLSRDQRWRVFADADTRPTRPPTWYRRQSMGERLLAARRAARVSA